MKKNCSQSFKGRIIFTSSALFVALLTNYQAGASGVPVITRFNPVSATPGNSVVIDGTNFNAVAGDNIVYFGAVRASVVSASETNLTVTVPVGATFAPITVAVNGLVACANKAFLPTFIGDGSAIDQSTFAPRQDLACGHGPQRTVIADLDGDGKPDLAVANLFAHTVSLFRSVATNGSLSSASFESRVDFPSIGGVDNPYNLIAADVDGDGKLDLVISDRSNNRVGVYRNVAVSGTLDSNSFVGPVNFDVGTDPRYVRTGDLDGDGRVDIVACNVGSGTISILRNTGTAGSLTTNSFATRFDLAAGAGAYDAAIGDMDGDGKPDIAVVNDGATVLSVFRNIATAGNLDANSFAPKLDLPAPIHSAAIILRDLDGDGKAEIIAGSFGNDSIYVYRNVANPGTLSSNSFQQRVEFPTGNATHDLALGDLNGDGKSDIAVAGELSSYLSVFQNLSTPGTFTSSSLGGRVDYATGWNAWGVSVGDLDGDSRPDVVFCNAYDDTVSIYKNVSPFDGSVIAGPVTNPANGHTYYLLSQSSWTEAETNAVKLGGHLVTINDAVENDWVVTTFSSYGGTDHSLWIGFNDTAVEGSFVWTSGEPVTYTNWRPGEPNNSAGAGEDYAYILGVIPSFPQVFGQWNDIGDVVTPGGDQPPLHGVVEVAPSGPPVIHTQPASQTVVSGNDVLFSVGVTGSPDLIYQWSFGATNLVGATNSTLTLTDVQLSDSGDYYVVVTNLLGSVKSSNAVLTVTDQPPNITVQPQSRSVFAASDVTFTVLASGSQPLSYQWQYNSADVPNATNSSFTLFNAQTTNSGSYSVFVTNVYGSTTSSNAVLTVNPPSGPPPFDSSLVLDLPIDGSVADQGPNHFSVTNNGGTLVTNRFGQTGSAVSLDGVNQYVSLPYNPGLYPTEMTLSLWVSFQSLDGCIWRTSNPLQDDWRGHGIIFSTPQGGIQYFDADGGTYNAKFNASTNVTVGQWYHVVVSRTTNSCAMFFNGVRVAFQTNLTSYAKPQASPMTFGCNQNFDSSFFQFCQMTMDTVHIYNRALSDGEVQVLYGSESASSPAIVNQPTNLTVAVGQTAVFNVSVSGGVLSYQWLCNSTNIVDATNASLVLVNVQTNQAGSYSVQVTNALGSTVSSNALLTVVELPPSIVSQPTDRTVTAGSNVTFTIVVSGSLPLSYQWQFNTVDIINATNSSFTVFSAQTTNSGSYSVFVTNVYGSTTSSNAVLTVTNQPPFISVQPQSRYVRLGSNTTFTVSAGGSGPLVYQWKLNETNIDGGTSSSLLLTNVQPVSAGFYSVQVTNVAGSVTSSNALLTLVSSVFFDDFDPNIDSPQWSAFGGTVLATNYGGSVSGSNSLWFGGSGSRFAATRSINTTSGGLIEFYLRIAGTTRSSNWEMADAGEGVVLEYSTNSGTSWVLVAQYNTPGYPNWTFISTNLPAAARSASTMLRWRQLSNSGSPSDHWALDDVNISMGLQPPQIVTQPTNRTLVIGQNTTFSVSVTGTVPISYQWRSNNVDIASATNAALILTNVQLSDAGNYSVRVANVVDSTTSSNAVLIVTLPPATVRVVNTTNMAGTSVTVPVVLLANGNENAVSFSLDFSTQHLAFVSIALGSDASDAFLFPNTSQAGNGRIGVIVAKPPDTTFVAGTQEVVQITFNTPLLLGTQSVAAAIVFTNTPITTKLSDVGAQALPAVFANGAVTLVTSDLEGDATPRPVGDRSLDIFDLVQVGRFVAGLDSPTNASEFQRADCAPRASSGDGQFKVTDWVQSGRYVAGLDPLTVAGGPDAPVAPGPLIGKRDAGGSREIVVADKKAIQGVTATLPVTLQSQGNENGLGFTLVFDSTKFVFAGASKGSAATAATFNVNSNQAAAGKVGLALILPSGSSFAAGSREVFKVNLKPKSSADGDYSLTFADQPVVRSVSDTSAAELSTVFTANAISVSPPPSLNISVQDTNAIVSWSVWAEGFNLQACADNSLTAGAWTNVVTTMQTNGENIAVTVPIADQTKYFRLQHP